MIHSTYQPCDPSYMSVKPFSMKFLKHYLSKGNMTCTLCMATVKHMSPRAHNIIGGPHYITTCYTIYPSISHAAN